MPRPKRPESPSRVLVGVPGAEDAAVLQRLLAQEGVGSHHCRSLTGLCRGLESAPDAVIVCEELLGDGGITALARALQPQPEWSDLPVLLMVSGGSESPLALAAMQELPHVLLLDRPMRLATFTSALRLALQSRRRQKQVRDFLVERQQVEAILRQREAEARAAAADLGALMDAVPAITFVARGSRCRKITMNRAAAQLLRLPPAANSSLTAPPARRPRHFQAFQDGKRLANTALPMQRAAARGEEIRGFEFTLVFDDGTSRELIGNAVPLRDERGAARGAIGAFVDITDRQRAEVALRQSEQEYRAMFELMGVGKAEADPRTGRFLRVNRKFCELTGYSEDELLHLTFVELTHPEDRAADQARFRRAMAGRSADWVSEKRYRRKDGQTIFVAVNGTLMRDARGRPWRSIAVVQDVSERWRAEESLRLANAELEERVRQRTQELLDTIAHLEEEARQRMDAEQTLRRTNQELRSRTEQLARLTLELNQAEERERRRIAQILHDHLQQLLVGARMQLSIIQQESTKADVRALVAKTDSYLDEAVRESRSLTGQLAPPVLHEGGLAAGLEWLARWMKEKHDLTVELYLASEDLPANATVRVLLFEAVRELLFNIVKHAGVRTAAVTLDRPQATCLRVEVADRGAGFQPSRSLAEARGAGFGLYSVGERLQLLGGRMTVQSKPRQGTRITITVPLSLKTAAPETDPSAGTTSGEAAAAPAPPTPARSTGNLRILVVDDHQILRDGLVNLLSQQPGFEVVGEAADGETAVNLTRELRPDEVIMDINMPGMNGIEATRRIAREHPGLPIIGLSMHEEADRASTMKQAGAAAYIHKNAPIGQLLALLRQHAPRLAGHPPKRARRRGKGTRAEQLAARKVKGGPSG